MNLASSGMRQLPYEKHAFYKLKIAAIMDLLSASKSRKHHLEKQYSVKTGRLFL
jgi:hypothetical protein